MSPREPHGTTEWSRRAIINVANGPLADHVDALTLAGAHAVLERTLDLNVPAAATGDGDLSLAPELVSSTPSIDEKMVAAGYELRTDATGKASRPGQWGRTSYTSGSGRTAWREQIDLLCPAALTGNTSASKRSVSNLSGAHGKFAVGSTPGLELAVYDRDLTRLTDIADPTLHADVHVAGTAALVCAKAYKIGERLSGPPHRLKDKDANDLWRLLAVADEAHVLDVFAEYRENPTIGRAVSLGIRHLQDVVTSRVVHEMARRSTDRLVDPLRITETFDRWSVQVATLQH